MNRTERKRRIGLLGASFNPAHNGHREISMTVLDKFGLDEIWWLVTPGNPLKEQSDYLPFDERMEGAKRIANHPQIVVSDFEKQHGLQYTVDTLRKLQATYSDNQFVWIMGADNLEQIHLWRDWRDIFAATPIIVISRPGHENAMEAPAAQAFAEARIEEAELTQEDGPRFFETPTPRWVFIEGIANETSSSAIRDQAEKTKLYAPHDPLVYLLDMQPNLGDFHADVLAGLSAQRKTISPKYFYDETGSQLFSQITELEEYYPTRTEKSIYEAHGTAITKAIGKNIAIFEYGSGASEKIDWLLTGLESPAAYVALDISREYLIKNVTQVAQRYPLPVAAVCADFNSPLRLPENLIDTRGPWLGYFPGSTLGNMTMAEAKGFLHRASATLGPNAQFLLGLDLEKDVDILHAAYNDRAGITAQFNLNLLTRMQKELGAQLTIDDFEHDAIYNTEDARIEMYLRAKRETAIIIDNQTFAFTTGETIHTENSHKFSVNRLEALLENTPWQLDKTWSDPKNWFAACLLRNK